MRTATVLKQGRQRGDTLIEVIFAFTVFSLTVVGAMTVMNQGAGLSQRALETTLVRQEIDSQAAALRFLHDSYVAQYQPGISYDANTPAGQWAQMLANVPAPGTAVASEFGASTVCPTPPSGSFILDARNARFVSPSLGRLQSATTFAQVTYDQAGANVTAAQGIWIEAIRSPNSTDATQSNTGYTDFHIRACWDAPGQGGPVTIGTIVRLYEPRG